MKIFKCENCRHIVIAGDDSYPACPYCGEIITPKYLIEEPKFEKRFSFNRGDVVIHFKGKRYEILYPRAKCCTNGKEGYVVVYKAYNKTGDDSIFVRDYDEFMSEVDRKKYPNSGQKYRFEYAFNVNDANIEKYDYTLFSDVNREEV